MKDNSKLLEVIICLAIGAYITVLLFRVVFATFKPLTKQLANIEHNTQEYNMLLKEIEK